MIFYVRLDNRNFLFVEVNIANQQLDIVLEQSYVLKRLVS